MGSEILVVDDQSDIRDLVSGILEDEGYSVRTSWDSNSALQEIASRRPSLIFLDVWLQGSELDGLQLLGIIKEQHPNLPVVIISGHGNVETAVLAIKRGAYDFIEKPFKADRLLLVASRALENSRLQWEAARLRERSGLDGKIIGESSLISQLRVSIDKVSKTNARVLISGSSGSGKELVARTIHTLSLRSSSPFLSLSLTVVNPAQIERELFGVEPGIGDSGQVGLLELAHGGTLYLDEIADMPLETQAKMLRVLLDQTFYRLGGHKPIKVDVRIISSSSRNLEAEIQENRLRPDFFHRLNVVPLRVPSLAERRDDIPELVHYFTKQISRAASLPLLRIGEDVMAILQSCNWPGNVRQLRNALERLMIFSNVGGGIEEDCLARLHLETGSALPLSSKKFCMERFMAVPLREAREIFEREYLLAQVNRFGGNVSRTAEFIGMERSALHRKLRLLGLPGVRRVPEC